MLFTGHSIHLGFWNWKIFKEKMFFMNAKQPHDFLLSNFNAGKIRTPTHI